MMAYQRKENGQLNGVKIVLNMRGILEGRRTWKRCMVLKRWKGIVVYANIAFTASIMEQEGHGMTTEKKPFKMARLIRE